MITLFQHGNDESAGEIETCLTEREIPHAIIRFFDDDPVPECLPSHLIILGGQMSVNDSADYPVFHEEKSMIRTMVAAGRPVLGICLGAQMIASAFGERVVRGPAELGWTGIHGCSDTPDPLFPGSFTVFHWHNETFGLPENAVLLATGAIVRNQAFRLGSAVGVQYHPEVTQDIITCWAKDLPAARKKALMDDSEFYREMNRRHCRSLVDLFLRRWNS